MTPEQLISAIRAALDETERFARSARQDFFTLEVLGIFAAYGDARHVLHHDPAAVLRRVAADREILDVHAVHTEGFFAGIHCQQCEDTVPCETVRLLARGLGINPEEETR